MRVQLGRIFSAPLIVLTVLTGFVLGGTAVVPLLVPTASAAETHVPAGQLVSDVAAPNTPHVLDGRVYSVVQVGDMIVLGGTFSRVRNDGESNELTRNGLVAFNATTGRISTTFDPDPNNRVRVVLPAADGTSVYVGGGFTSISGAARQRVAQVNVSDGSLVSAFNAGGVTGEVRDLALSAGRLWVGGAFTHVGGVGQKALVALNPTTGAVTPYMSLVVDGYHNEGATQVMKMDITPDGSRLVAVGNFDTLEGVTNHQLFVLDLTGPNAAPSGFRTSFYTSPCASVFDSYMRDVDISPDGRWFAVTTTGAYRGSEAACDTVARFELTTQGDDVRPSWVDYSGGDTTYGVEITSDAVYVGGHHRWWNNPFAGDREGPGAVSREGIAALDPVNGLPFSWNPGRAKGVGVFDFLHTEQGLWVVSDTDRIGDWQLKSRVARFNPQGSTFDAVAPPSLPSDVYSGGTIGAASDPAVLYRVNAGGGALGAGSGIDWAPDSNAEPSAHHLPGSNRATWSPVPSVDATVPAGTPRELFDSELWDPSSAPEQQWAFPVDAGTPVEVRLFFANRCGCTQNVGQRRFDVDLEGVRVLSDFDIVAAVGHNVGTMRSYEVTSDGSIDVVLGHIVENPLLNGIEVRRTDVAPPTDNDDLRRRSLGAGGAGAGPTTVAPAGGIEWGGVRGAFMVNGDLYTALADGSFSVRSFDGTAYGPVRSVDAADQLVPLAAWAGDIRSATGMFFDGGRIYFTLVGSDQLYYRYFTPESGVVGAKRLVASGPVAGSDFEAVRGMFVTADHLFWGESDGTLHRMDWRQTDQAAEPVAGTASVVSGPGTDSADWSARTSFIYQGPEGAAVDVDAAFTHSCVGLTCAFDGTSSQVQGTTISSYDWAFGDGAGDSGATVEHTYAGAGTFPVTLTVTTSGGATSSTTEPVTVSAAGETLAHVASTSSGANSNSHDVDLPAAVQPGDRLVLHVTLNNANVTHTGPPGWSALDTVDGRGVTAASWTRVAAPGDAGTTVTVDVSDYAKGVLSLSAYRSSSGSTTVAAHAGALDSTSGTSHTAPDLTVASSGAWVVTSWVTKSSTAHSLTAPASSTVRTTDAGFGGGRLTSLVADIGPVAPGQVAGAEATSGTAVSRTVMFATAISPG
ncbi:PKD domain-containing protein [Nocardioides sp.]|uniref:PKD domain-containing protein n=1 Tax=Nocardioides sp. TaxID=35761 RepID=UPI002B26C446|nr:PKD domain-containing protein [Nocardioides sp.]